MPNNLKSISSHLFEGCSSITSIMIPDNVTYINNKAFSGCSSLISISIPNSVTSIDQYAFEGCSNLPSITIPNKVKKISSSTFSGCRSLISVSIPKSVTSIDQYAFSECSSLTSITIPSSVSEIQIPVFSGCSNLETIQVETDNNIYDSRNNSNAIIQTADNVLLIGCKNTVIPNSVTSISVSAFQDCKSLASIIIPNSVTSIGEKAFSGCSSLASLFIPNSMINIAQSAFWGCEGLEKIQVESDNKTFDSRDNCNAIIQTDYNLFLIGCKNSFIPKSVSVVGSYAFYNISCLNTITIPSSVTSIGSSAFWGCKLESVVCRSPKISLYNAFSSATYNHAVLYIPEGKRWETIYDGDWYQSINIRETAMDVNDLDPQTAYTLMNAETFQYTVYDPVNNQLKNIKDFHNVDESVANNSWQIVQADGQKYLYNIGARKFATMNTSNQWTLTDNPTPLSIMSDEDGRMTINGLDSKWFFVINEQTSVDQSVTAIGVVVENSDADENSYFTLEGKRIESPRKGLNIIRMNDGKVKKVMRK